MEKYAILKVAIDPQGVITGATVAGQGFEKVKQKSKESTKATEKQTTAFQKFGDTAKYVRGLLYGAAAYTLYRSITRVVDATDAHENAVVKLNAVLKSTSGAVGITSEGFQAWAAQMQNVTGVQDELLLNSQAVMLTFTQISGEIMPLAMRAVMDTAEVFGGLDQATIQLGKALNDPIIGLTALRRIGISFNEEQSNMIKNLAASGNLLEAQREILAEIEREYGGVAEAMGKTFSGEKKKTFSEFQDVLEKLGENLTKEGGIVYTGVVGLNNVLEKTNEYLSEQVVTMDDVIKRGESVKKAFDDMTEAQFRYNQGILPGDLAPENPFDRGPGRSGRTTPTGSGQPEPFKIKVRNTGVPIGGRITPGQISPDDIINPGKIITVAEEMAELAQKTETARVNMIDLDAEMEKAFGSTGEFDRRALKVAIDKTITSVGSLADSFPDIAAAGKTTAEEMDNAFTRFFKNNEDMVLDFKNHFTDAIMDMSQNGMESIGDFFDYMAKGFLRMEVQKLVTEPVFAGIENFFHRASGGPVRAGQPYMTGENGPELIVPSSNGTVIPNHQLGGGTVVQIIDKRGANAPAARVEKQRQNGVDLYRVVIEATKSGMADGEFNSIFQNQFGLMAQGR